MKKLLITLIVVIVVAGAAGGAYYYKYGKPPEPEISTQQVTRGDVIQRVGATGTIEAVTTVDVGTQVTGVIMEMYADFNKIVKKGQLIAKIDPKTIEATIERDKANLESALANLERQKVSLEDSKNKLRRAEDLFRKNLATQQDLETAQVTVKTNEASIKGQDASIKQTKAQLNQDLVHLEYTNISAPIDGIVINRRVELGQTVVSNNLATSLFLIAADLTKMQVKAGVDESDVGKLRPGQRVTFRVDAFPEKEFVGSVSQVRLQPVVTQNVVTYTTMINVPNPKYELRPGMTATVNIEIARRENALRIPLAATRFRPTREIFEALNLPLPPELLQRGRGQGGTGGGATGGGQGQNVVTGGQQGQGGRAAAAFERGGGDRGTLPTDRQAMVRPGGEGQQAAPGQPRGGQPGPGGEQMTPEQRQQRMQERMAQMTPDERRQFEERMKQFGQGGLGRGQGSAEDRGMGGRGRPAANEAGPSEGTIDALFGPLTFTELRGRVWIYAVNGTTKSLKAYNIRTGIDDGTYAVLVEGPGLEEGTRLVTNIDTGQQTTQQLRSGSSPLMPGRGGPGGFGGPGGGRGR